MSGLEALYWAQEYPEEVAAIIGLDMAVPHVYQDYPINSLLINLSSLTSKIGVTRLISNVSFSDAELAGNLISEEVELSKALFYKKHLPHQ